MCESEENTRIITSRDKKHLIKLNPPHYVNDNEIFGVTVVRERNTWQTKATKDGSITGIHLNQGIIGDLYYIYILPAYRTIFGFTSGPSGTLKSVCKFILEQLNTNRRLKIKIDLIPKAKGYISLNDYQAFNSLHFKMNSSYLSEITDDAPHFFKQLSTSPYIGPGMQLSFDLEFNDENCSSFTKDNVIEIINFLSDHDGCSTLKVKANNSDGKASTIDFSDTFLHFKTEVNTRNKYIDEESASRVLDQALLELLNFKNG
ncbi:hypothetical protein BN1200_300049 [Klebsiella variicola]|uniref:Uncharacterized protein n=1 Tax=Raoultella planticola TaxID=575 RepID=A0A485CS58_RAOPL|nr:MULTISPECIES: hypothetical protein [Klebsiella/Raoultella group]KFD08138.1 hypothetical protein GRPL_02644 [Raoultella planticola ATCC 33531]CTQ06799.1 hypothetical protein BN1200_300049 [Klebsiella variicola]VFS87331.1 Uncharacterised protein [Raoultella planticola]